MIIILYASYSVLYYVRFLRSFVGLKTLSKSHCDGRYSPHQHPGREWRRGSLHTWLWLNNQKETVSVKEMAFQAELGSTWRGNESDCLCHQHIFVWGCVPLHCFYMKHYWLRSVFSYFDSTMVVFDNTGNIMNVGTWEYTLMYLVLLVSWPVGQKLNATTFRLDEMLEL